MNNFENLNHFIIPPKLLLKLTNLYQNIGQSNYLINKLEEEHLKKLKLKTLNQDTYYLSNLLELNITENRKKQLIEKDHEAKNKEEKTLLNLKKVLSLIDRDVQGFNLNASELINYINLIYNDKTKYREGDFTALENKIKHSYSVRFLINKEFDDFDDYLNNQKYENVILVSIILSDIYNLSPLSKHNDAGLLIALYYLLKEIKLAIINYQSFFEIFESRKEKLLDAFNRTTINYQNGFLNPAEITEGIIDILNELFLSFKNLTKETENKKNGNKQLYIENTILKLPTIFTKDDIRKIHPEASDTTIQRALNNLKNNELIMPLGTGRNAQWRKNVEKLNDLDLSKIIGE